MKKIAARAEIVSIEEAANRNGLTYDEMMESAGKRVSEELISIFRDVSGIRVLVLAGTGNNGGDGLAAAYHLKQAGAEVGVYLSKNRGNDDANFNRAVEIGCSIQSASQDSDLGELKELASRAEIIVDALLGTGFSLPLRGAARNILKTVGEALEKRNHRPFIAAVDCPSGMEVDTGETAQEILDADVTITFAAAKQGFFTRGAAFLGQLKVVDIGIPAGLEEMESINTVMPEKSDIKELIPERPLDAHKGTFGKLLVIAGSVNYPGAAALAADAAYRIGAGLVTLAVPGNIQALIAPRLWEATWLLLPHEVGVIHESAVDVIRGQLKDYDACIIGPGLGREPSTRHFLDQLLFENKHQKAQIGFLHGSAGVKGSVSDLPPSVLDADGLNLLAEMPGWAEKLPGNCVLTPHPGEMSRLTGLDIGEIQQERVGTARSFSKKWGVVVVLKGAFTVVAEPGGDAAVIPIATPALARAGSGDVLAGVIGGMLAQGVEPFEAALAGAYLHGTAGKISMEVTGNAAGVIATDITELLPSAINEIS